LQVRGRRFLLLFTFFLSVSMAQQPLVGQCPLIIEASRWKTQHNW
jgi:hypothetical protein